MRNRQNSLQIATSTGEDMVFCELAYMPLDMKRKEPVKALCVCVLKTVLTILGMGAWGNDQGQAQHVVFYW
ncbi:MAG: hypothetical protein B5M56_06080 [Desulfococcus sp. 4484_241]|nr:MAG: hypothetical protein B5M56_06080 [Desulfococcus sp. 4484_241]